MAEREPEQSSKGRKRKSIEAVVKELGRELNVGIPELRGPSRSWVLSKTRTMIEYVLVQRLGYTLKEVASYFGRDIAAVATLLGRMEERMAQDEELREKIEWLNKKVES